MLKRSQFVTELPEIDAGDYSTNVDPSKILDDARFIQDLRDHYAEKGLVGDDEALIERFYTDRTWADLNTMGAIGDAVDASTVGADTRARMRRIENVWRSLPSFWQEGGRGSAALGDIAGAVIADPLNLIPGVAAGKAAATGARAAYLAGKSAPALRGTVRGVTRGAGSEALISGAQEGIVNTAQQIRDVELGLQDEFSYGQLGTAAGLGAVMGAGVGSVIGAPAAAIGARRGVTQGVTDEAAALARAAEIEAEDAAAAAAVQEEPLTPAQQTDRARQERVSALGGTLEERIRAAEEALTAAKRDPETPANEVSELELENATLKGYRGVLPRLEAAEKEIATLESSNDLRKLDTARERRIQLERISSDLEARLTGGTDPVDDIVTRIEELRAQVAEDAAGEVPAAPTAATAEAAPAVDTPAAETPAEAPAPAATERPTLAYTKNQQERAQKILADAGMSEDDLADMVASGRVELTKDGKIGRASIKQLQAAIEGDAGTAELSAAMGGQRAAEAPAEAPVAAAVEETPPAADVLISPRVQAYAVEQGIDYSQIEGTGKNGRIVKGDITRASKAKVEQAAENNAPAPGPDPRIAQAQEDLNSIADLLESFPGLERMSDQDIREYVRMLAETDEFSSSADDILAAFDSEALRVGPQKMEPLPEFTTTEKKTMRNLAKAYRDGGDAPDVAMGKAQLEILKRRQEPAPAKASEGRSSQAAIERGQIFETAGRSATTGRIQSILRRGTRISKDSDYTTTSAGLGARETRIYTKATLAADEALARARRPESGAYNNSKQDMTVGELAEKNGRDPIGIAYYNDLSVDDVVKPGKQIKLPPVTEIVEFEATHEVPNVRSEGGIGVAPKGSTLYADGKTQRIYTSREAALLARGDIKAARRTPEARTTAETNDLLTAMEQARQSGDGNTILRLLKEASGKVAKAPEAVPASPLVNGDRVAIIRSRTRPADVRLASRNQVSGGGDIRQIISRDPSKANIDDWEVRYVTDAQAESVRGNSKARRELFESAEIVDATNENPPSVSRRFVGNATGLDEPMTSADFRAMSVSDVDVASISAFRAQGMRSWDDVMNAVRSVLSHGEFMDRLGQAQVNSGADVFNLTGILESTRYPNTREKAETVTELLRGLYEVQREMAPGGFLMPTAERAAAVEEIGRIFDKFSPEETANAQRFISRLGGDPSRAPIFVREVEGYNYTYANPHRTENSINFNPERGSKEAVPQSAILYHEVAHWAYRNILTPEDRLQFWEAYSKRYYDESGRLTGVDYTFGGTVSNNMSPQELFANQFSSWALTGKSDGLFQDPSFWQRITRYVQEVFNVVTSGKLVDEELVPLFSKILPEEQRQIYKLGVDAPSSDYQRAIFNHYERLTFAEQKIEEALASGDDIRIVDAFSDFRTVLAGAAPGRAYKQGGLNPGATFTPFRRYEGMIRDRFADINEVLHGKALPEEYRGEDINLAAYLPEEMRGDMVGEGETFDGYQVYEFDQTGASISSNVEAKADMLADMYDNGHLGEFSPSLRPTGGNPENTSIRQIIGVMKGELEVAYAADGARLNNTNVRSAVATARSQQTKVLARRGKKQKDAAVERASAKASQTRAKRARSGKGSNVDPEMAQEIKGATLDDLIDMARREGNTDRGDQIAIEIMARKAAEPLPQTPVKITKEIYQAQKPELRVMLKAALEAGDKTAVDQIAYELQRRAHGKATGVKISPMFREIRGAVQAERLDNIGVPSSDGIPASARGSVRSALGYMTHRDPNVEVAMRTMLYRMMNLMGRTARGTADNANFMTMEDLGRLAGADVGSSAGAFVDFRSPAYGSLRKDMRRLSVGLKKGSADPFTVMHEIGHMIVRSGAIPGVEMDAIRAAYRASDDTIKGRIDETYRRKYADRDLSDLEMEDVLAEEWFSESLAKYMGERVAKGDILQALATGNTSNLAMRSQLSRAIDRAIEYVAYVLNGVIGRNDIKQQFRRITFYGNMFETPSRRPMSAQRGAVSPAHASMYASDRYLSAPRSKQDKVRRFIGNGTGYSQADDAPVPFYHATPAGYKFRRDENPDVVLMDSDNGLNGPGIYLSQDAHSTSTYGERPTFRAYERLIRERVSDPERQAELMFVANNLNSLRIDISKKRRELAINEQATPADEISAMINKEMIDELRQDIDGLVSLEMSFTEDLARAGVVPDPMVIPLYVRALNTADFTDGTSYAVNDPFVSMIQRRLAGEDEITSHAVNRFTETLSDAAATDGSISGRDLYRAFTQAYVASGLPISEGRLNATRILIEEGYDSVSSTHFNTVDSTGTAGRRMLDGRPYGAESKPHEVLVVFDSENVKHVDADFFDETDRRLYYREDTTAARDLTGDMTAAATEGGDLKTINWDAATDSLETAGVPPGLAGTLNFIGRGRDLTPANEVAARKAGPLGFLSSQSDRMSKMGMNWISGWYRDHFPDINQRFAKTYMPLHKALRELPDADGKVRAWARRSTAGVMQDQPKSYQRIVKALRYGPESREWKSMEARERAVASQIRGAFADELRKMRELGMIVGRRENYVPQVWDKTKIQAERDEFLEGMARYYKMERTARGEMAADADALQFAERMYDTLASDEADGVFAPISGSTRNPRFESADYTRMIELEKYPAAMRMLEKYLESDLEGLMVKYFEGSTRRLVHTEKLGLNSHGFYDYLMTVDQGRDGIVRLLSSNKEYKKDFRYIDSGGYPQDGTVIDTTKMPFDGREEDAALFVEKLVETFNTGGAGAARQMLIDIAPMVDGAISPTYKRRVDAIIGGLNDFGGEPAKLGIEELRFADNAMRVARRQPLTSFGGQTAYKASRAIRNFNSVSLLSFTTLTSMGDLVLPIIRSGSFSDWAKGVKKYAEDPEYRQMLKEVGVAMESIVHDRMTYLYGAADGKLTNAFFNATMLTPWTDMNRQIAGATGIEAFKTMQTKTMRAYNPNAPLEAQPREYKVAYRFLARYGLQEFAHGQRRGLESLGNSALLKDSDEFRRAVIKFADDTIFTPNPNDIPQWAQTPFGALAFQLKSFPLMLGRLGKYAAQEALNKEARNVKPLLYFATLGPAFGAGTLALKDVIQMRGGEENREADLRNRNLLKTLGYDSKVHGDVNDFWGWYMEGMMMMGGLGILGDVIHSAATNADNGAYGQQRFASTLLGPTFGLVNSGMTVLGGAKDALTGGDNSNSKERAAAREVLTRIPVLGGVRAGREAAVDIIAGEPSGNASGWGGGGWKGGWK